MGDELLTRALEESQATKDSDYFGLASYEGSYVVSALPANEKLCYSLLFL